MVIRTAKITGYVVLSVEDNGPGIDKQNFEMIFERCTRLNSDVEGTGLGLYLVRTMIENSGGKIEVESAPGEGSIFRVYFKS